MKKSYEELSEEEITMITVRAVKMYRAGKWGDEPSETSVNKVDRSAVRTFYDNAVEAGRMKKEKLTVPAILSRLGLVSGTYLTNSGELLFGNTRPVNLQAAIFATEDKMTILDLKLFEGNFFNLLSEAKLYIFKNIRWQAEIVGFKRKETPEIPVAAIEEILANAFAHAYYGSNTQHAIHIHPNMLSIYSPGIYASDNEPEEYINGNLKSEIMNPTIAKVLYLNGSIRKSGSGFKKIDSALKAEGLEYEFITSDQLGCRAIIHRPPIPYAVKAK